MRCDSANYRILYGANECKCNLGTYDDGEHTTCAECHYTWFIFIILFLFSSHKNGDLESCSGPL